MGGYVFPDAAKCVKRVLDKAGFRARIWLSPEDVDGRETVHVQDMGGTEVSVFRTDRILFDCYAGSRDAARDLAETVKVLLVDRPHDTVDGDLDTLFVEVVPTFEPYPSDTVSKYNMILRAESRPI